MIAYDCARATNSRPGQAMGGPRNGHKTTWRRRTAVKLLTELAQTLVQGRVYTAKRFVRFADFLRKLPN